jgi:Ser/Thr protein kinase RdoA (MazF antagonist)
MFAMEFLDPTDHPVWKQQLLAGEVNIDTAHAVGQVVGVLHQASAHRADLAAAFSTFDNFYALRLEPYLVATAARHPGLAIQLHALVQRTAETSIALVHGDISPKNILVGPHGPVVLDAECAWYGDPAFDVAFCLNHLMLKRLVVPAQADALHAAFAAWVSAYFSAVSFESRAELEARCAQLLPALMLARVDGKSPVEYLGSDADREQVRSFAIARISHPTHDLLQLSSDWIVKRRA